MSDITTNKQDRQKQFILSHNLWRVMFQLSWPAIIAMVLYGLNTVIDAVFVGQFVGKTALAGISLVYPLTQISLGIGSLIGVGAGSVLSIAIGAKNESTQNKLFGNVNYITIVTTVVFMILGLLFSKHLVVMMGGKGEELLLGDKYFRVTIIGSVFWIYGLASNMIVRSEGKMKSAAVMMGIGMVVNIIANYILIVLLNFGVKGAAWGTNIGMFIYTLLGWIYFGGGFSSFKTRVFVIYRDKEIVTSIIRLGASSLIMTVMTLIQSIFVFNALSKYGTTSDVAFYGVVYRIFMFLLTPIFGLMRALQPTVGINYGANKYDRVIKSFKVYLCTSTLLTLPFWIISMITPSSILGMMLPNQVFSAAEIFQFRIFMAILPVVSVIFMGMTFFPSIDKGKPAAMIGIVRQVVFYVPVMIFVPKYLGVKGIYIGSFGIDFIIVLWTFILVKKEFTLLRKRKEK